MKRVWLISNPHSGSTSEEKCEALAALFAEPHARLVGRSTFPRDELPTVAELVAAGAQGVILFAGDGTINAAASLYDDWDGTMLILPGGTMNMLSRRLHGTSEPHEIVERSFANHREVRLPLVEAGGHRAFVALIVGPAAAWGYAREAARYGRYSRMLRAARFAWARTFSRGITVQDPGGRHVRQRAAVFVPGDGTMSITSIRARGWAEIVALGWEYLVGDWHDAPGVHDSRAARAIVNGPRAIHGLFDGEEVKLASPVEIRSGLSHLRFVSTSATGSG